MTCLRGWRARAHGLTGPSTPAGYTFPEVLGWVARRVPAPERSDSGGHPKRQVHVACVWHSTKHAKQPCSNTVRRGRGAVKGDSLIVRAHTPRPPCPLVGPRPLTPHTASAASRLPSGTAISSSGITVSSNATLCARAADALSAGSAALPCVPCCSRSCAPCSRVRRVGAPP